MASEQTTLSVSATQALKLFRFACVGFFVLGIDLALIWILRRYLPSLVAVGLAYCIAVTTHYALNKWWVFSCQNKVNGREILAYVTTVILCLGCTLASVETSLHFLTQNIFKAKLLAAVPTTLLGYWAMRTIVFGTRDQ